MERTCRIIYCDGMSLILLALAQAISPAPDLQIGARVRARRVTIERQGDARLTVTSTPDGGNVVDVTAPSANGRSELRNVEVGVRAEARIADPGQARDNNLDQPETVAPR